MSHLSPVLWKQKASHCASYLFTDAGLDAYCEQISLINYMHQGLTRTNARGWNSSWLERKWPLIQCFPADWSQAWGTLSCRNCVKSVWQLQLHHPVGLLSSSYFLGISYSWGMLAGKVRADLFCFIGFLCLKCSVVFSGICEWLLCAHSIKIAGGFDFNVFHLLYIFGFQLIQSENTWDYSN